MAGWIALGGWAGLTSDTPIYRHDHTYYYHNAMIAPDFLRASGTTSGYDPSFMSGYPKSIISINSSTLPELVFAATGPAHRARAYKAYVLACIALIPWLVAGAGVVAGARPAAIAWGSGLLLLYFWTDFPMSYAMYGMLPYFVSVPLGLLTASTIGLYLERGGFLRWLASAAGGSLVFLVHVTSAMIVGPAAGVAYAAAVVSGRRSGGRLPRSRHVGFWLIAPVVLAVNAFWWLPGAWLVSTRGPSGYLFSHPEPVLGRVGKIAVDAPAVQSVLIGAGLIGLVALARRRPLAAASIGGFGAAGFAWGYLAGGSRALDLLQPGRQTFALYTASALLGGIGLAEARSRMKAGGPRLAAAFAIGLALVGARMFGQSMVYSVRRALFTGEPFLSSRPSPSFLWVVDRVRRHVKPGERLLYEEVGMDDADPFDGGRYSGLLPHLVEGIELIGGPYLHSHVTANFTQFGEGKLFGRADWNRDHFVRYARLYRPSAIVCWSPRALQFCRSHPDLIEVVEDLGGLLIARVVGFEGPAIEGSAVVEASPGRLKVSQVVGDAHGRAVLRYHWAPHLRSTPEAAIEPVYLEADPVPFIGLHPQPGPITLELDFPP